MSPTSRSCGSAALSPNTMTSTPPRSAPARAVVLSTMIRLTTQSACGDDGADKAHAARVQCRWATAQVCVRTPLHARAGSENPKRPAESAAALRVRLPEPRVGRGAVHSATTPYKLHRGVPSGSCSASASVG
jgi:hypothetical protein